MSIKAKQNHIKTIEAQFDIIKQGQYSSELSYEQLLHILSHRRVPLIKSSYYLRKKYNNQIPDWHKLRKQDIIQQLIALQKSQTNNQWQYRNCSPKRYQAIKQLYQKYENNNRNKSKQQIKNRINTLNDQISNCQRNINILKKQQDLIQQLNKFKQFKNQLKYWKNKKRIIKNISLQSSLLSSPRLQQSYCSKINRIQTQIQMKRQQSVQQINKNIKLENIDRVAQLKRLEKIFNFYAKNKNLQKDFNNITSKQQKINLESYIKFIKQFNINRILSYDQIIKLFRKKSNRQANLTQFCQLFQDIYRQQCKKLDKIFIVKQFDQYLVGVVVPKHKIQKALNLKPKHIIQSHYQFTPVSHTGKFKQAIISQLALKKIQSKTKKISPQNPKNNVYVQDSLTIKANQTKKTNKTISRQINYGRSRITSYAKQYAKQKKSMSYQTVDTINNYPSRQKAIPYQSQHNPEHQLNQLSEIIHEQEDEYLKHYLLPPLKTIQENSRLLTKKFHF